MLVCYKHETEDLSTISITSIVVNSISISEYYTPVNKTQIRPTKFQDFTAKNIMDLSLIHI